MLRRLSRTLYTCTDPQALIQALEARGWRRETPDERRVAAQLNQRDALIIVYENSEVTAVGALARETLHALWARKALH